MTNARRSLVVLVACSGVVLAGCGGAISSSSTPAAGTTHSGASRSPSLGIPQAVAACKASVSAQSSISATIKRKLYSICDEAGAGDQAAVKKATAQVCIEVVKESVPAADQQAAEANCPKG